MHECSLLLTCPNIVTVLSFVFFLVCSLSSMSVAFAASISMSVIVLAVIMNVLAMFLNSGFVLVAQYNYLSTSVLL